MNDLKAGFERHEEHLARVDVRLALMAEKSANMASQLATLSSGFADLSGDQVSLRSEFILVLQSNRDMRLHVERMAKILNQALSVTSDRLDDIELRLARLEKKTG